jgi:two-component system CheB/CheR fusion protein
LLLAELDHRVKNVLATVGAVAASTLESSSSMSHFVAALDARIRALASTHELLSNRQWQGLPLDELLKHQFAPYAAHNNADIKGPYVLLKAEAGQALSMVLHELVTNAAKHGALSTSAGRISVQWRLADVATDDGRLVLDWREIGGPAVKAPGKSGYGKSVITELIPYELGGKVDFKFTRSGVRCRLEIPLALTIATDQPGRKLSEADCDQASRRSARELHTQYG